MATDELNVVNLLCQHYASEIFFYYKAVFAISGVATGVAAVADVTVSLCHVNR